MSISHSLNQQLTAPASTEEIRKAVFSMHPNKAPGPDDDSLLFCEASIDQALVIKEIVEVFNLISGQEVNLAKSSILFSKNTSQGAKEGILSIFSGTKEEKKARYLGLPLFIGKSKRETFHFVVDAVKSKVNNWKSHFLNNAGKEVLIKAVINALPVYVMSCFRLPSHLCKEIYKIASNFWWGTRENGSHKLHWKDWDKMTKEKGAGGLGFQEIQRLNDALLAKQLWRIVTCPNLPMAKLLKAKYFPRSSLFEVSITGSSSWLWKCWMKARHVLVAGSVYKTADGSTLKLSDALSTPNRIGLKIFWKKHGCEGSDRGENMKRLWLNVWKVKIKNKVKHFLWRCVHDVLPTKINLKKRGVQLDTICSMCGEEDQTMEHIFSSCSRACNTWKLAPVSWNCLKEIGNFKDWWGVICSGPKKEVFQFRVQLSVYILWMLWKTRNLWIFKGEWREDRTIIELAGFEWAEFLEYS